MKKIFVLLLTLIFCPLNVLANSGSIMGSTVQEQSIIEHSSKEANFRLQTYAPWSQMTIEKKNLDKNPGWLVRFHKAGEAAVSSPFAFYVVDGRKNEDIKQTSEDFARGHAKFILFQIVEAEKMRDAADGLVLRDSEVKEYAGKNYIYLQYESQGSKIYRIMTALNNYTYSFNAQAVGVDEQQIKDNLELMMKSLSKY